MKNRVEFTNEPEGYLDSKEVGDILGFSRVVINSYCGEGLFEGAFLDKKWLIPKYTVEKLVLKKELVTENFYTVTQLAEALGTNNVTIRSMIDAGVIKTESITILRETRDYISKDSVADLLERKKCIDAGVFISRTEAAREFGFTVAVIKNLEDKKLMETDKFLWFGITHIKRESLKSIIDARTIKDGYMTAKEAAIKLGRDEATVTQWCVNGKIPNAYKLDFINGTWVIPCVFVEKVIEERKKKEESLKQYMTMNQFCEKVGQTYKVVSTRIKNGSIPDFVKIDSQWYIPVEKVSDYVDNLEWLNRKVVPRTRSDDYYSKENMIEELKVRIEEISDSRLPVFTELFVRYGIEILGKTRIKGYGLKSVVTDLVNVYNKIILLISNDFGEGIENDIQEALIKTAASDRIKQSFNAFLNFAFGLKDIKRKKEFSVKRVKKSEEEELEPYSPEIYQEINLYAREIDEHIPRALKSATYANMWVYVLLHLTDVWRHSDLVEKLPPVTLEQIGITQHNWFKVSKMSLEQCQKIINELYMKLSPEETNKTSARLMFLVEPTLIECLGHALVISEIHRRKKGNNAKLLYTFITRDNANSTVHKNHLSFFDRKQELKVFRNQKMNRSTMTYFHYSIVEEDADNADVALAYAQQVRSHEKNKTTSIYVKVMNKDGSVNRVASNLFKRGHFGWLYNYMIIAALDGTGSAQSLEDRTQTIELLKNDLSTKELEDWAKFLYAIRTKKQNVIQQLSNLPKEELVALIKKIFNQEMPAKTKPGQCMVYPNCKYPGRKNCFGCEYFIPQYYVLIEAAKEFKRLVKSMIEARFETTFTRDKKWLMTTFTVIQEAKAIYPSEQVNGFILPSEIRIGLENLKTKKFIE